MQHQIERLQTQLGDIKGKSNNIQCASNTLDPLSQKLDDENVSLEFQLHTKFSEQQNKVKGTSVNAKFAKPSILGKPPSTSGTKLYYVTPFPKPVTSHSVPKTQESKVMNNMKVIAPRMFRINPTMNSRVDNFVPNKHVKSSVRTKPITISQPHVITKKDVNSNTNGLPSTGVESTAKTRRPQPRSNPKNDRIPSTSKSSCLSKNLERRLFVLHKNQSANFSERANQKKHKTNVKKLMKLGSEERLASPRPSKPRTCLRWLPTGIIFDLSGTITESSNTESEFDTSVCDNASASKPREPTSNGFPNFTSFLDRFT
ncbi:hypothetical protein Tco_1363862 [Tanacetum coccineum]